MDKARKTFIERTLEKREKRVDDFTGDIIRFFLVENLPFYDTHYILHRALEIIQESIEHSSFDSEEINRVRRSLLKKKIGEVRRNLWGFKEELEELRAVPEKERTGEQRGRISQLENIIKREPEDETEERDLRCEKSARELVKILLNEKLLFEDEEYINEAIKGDDSLLLLLSFKSYYDALKSKLEMVISRHEQRVYEHLLGKEREQVTFKDLDLILNKIDDERRQEKEQVGTDSDSNKSR